MFDRIAHRYDLLNRLMSFGIDRRWRRRAVRSLAISGDAHVLDLATGTGDPAFDILRRHPDATVVGIDPSPRMLELADAKASQRNVEGRFETRQGIAEVLPLADNSVDAVCIGFGIRNVPDRAAGLREMVRVTRPGGHVAVLELSEPRGIAKLYVHHLMPRIGALISGAREYRYLQSSIAAFPPPDEFVELMSSAGFTEVTATRLSFGVCHLYVGKVGGAS